MHFSKRTTATQVAGKHGSFGQQAATTSYHHPLDQSNKVLSQTQQKPLGSNRAFGRSFQQPNHQQARAPSRQHQSMGGPGVAYENDFRCEFDLPKFTDLRQTMLTRSQKQSILSSQGRDTLASSTTAATGEIRKPSLANNHGGSPLDENFQWFQEDHDFRIMTRAQMQKIQRMRLQPKLNSTAPLPDDNNAVSKKRTWKEVTQGVQQKKEVSKGQQSEGVKRTLEQSKSVKSYNNPAVGQTGKAVGWKQQPQQSAKVEFCQNKLSVKQVPQNQAAAATHQALSANRTPARNFIELNKQRIRDKSAQKLTQNGSARLVDNIKNKIGGCLFRLRSTSTTHAQNHQTTQAGKHTASAKALVSGAGGLETSVDLSIKKIRDAGFQENGAASTAKTRVLYDDQGKASTKSANQRFQERQNRAQSAFQRTNTNQEGGGPLQKQKSAFLYEPTMVSSKIIRAWQQQTGHKWYELSPQSRNKMNVALKSHGLEGAIALFQAETTSNVTANDDHSSRRGHQKPATQSKRVTRSMSQSVLSTPSLKNQQSVRSNLAAKLLSGQARVAQTVSQRSVASYKGGSPRGSHTSYSLRQQPTQIQQQQQVSSSFLC